ncbi:GNAT family N-acetyltransferase [Paenibacillus sp. CAA11]|uniref:GNAT family N-acetyltransferase n=1 Tax=Paenibacillus sp. CAA11 TaxID=1532905 RepID=UPI000D34EE97|nr:GNAT family N-acetyltransferase [Paenibacillus sp. CAA11]AWB44514.1 GNAT family N-acetyltransferase [Paenibacillus sp. CAA11]
MKITVTPVLITEKSVLRNLLELYKYDFSEFDPEDVNEHGLYDYPYLDYYWTEDGRHPFFIKVDGNLAGLALVRTIDGMYAMAEFFVMKKYRCSGVGRYAAGFLFDQFPGEWKVSELDSNFPAQAFWRKVIGEYTAGSFYEICEADWDGPIQRFNSLHKKHIKE